MSQINKMRARMKEEMAQLPESLSEVKEYCSNCGRVLDKDSGYIRATIEQVTRDGETIVVDSDRRYFCGECLKNGVYISVRNPENEED